MPIKCNECGTGIMIKKKTIVTNVEKGFSYGDNKPLEISKAEIYQCPKCKNIEIIDSKDERRLFIHESEED